MEKVTVTNLHSLKPENLAQCFIEFGPELYGVLLSSSKTCSTQLVIKSSDSGRVGAEFSICNERF